MDVSSNHFWRYWCTTGMERLMNTEQLRRKARELYNNKEVPQGVNQYNQRKWVRSVLKLGDKWLLAKNVGRIQ